MLHTKKSILSFIICGIVIFASCNRTSKHPQLAAYINSEYKLHPKMDLQDVYKFLYQSEFGPNHLMTNSSAAKEYLLLEAQTKSESKNLPLREICSPDTSLLRINLQPFKEKNLLLDTLFICLEETAVKIQGSGIHFGETWKQVGELITEFSIPFTYESYQNFTKLMQEKNYPAVHHSQDYTTEYHPSYRIVLKSVFEKHFPDVK